MDKKSYLLWGIALFLVSFFALHAHIHERGFNYINAGNQVLRHEARLAGESPFYNPWQYRILSSWAVELQVTAYEKLEFATPYYSAFTHFRFAQQIIIFALCFFYFRRFTPNHLLALTGVVLLGYAMSYSVWNSDLSFDTYTDIIGDRASKLRFRSTTGYGRYVKPLRGAGRREPGGGALGPHEFFELRDRTTSEGRGAVQDFVRGVDPV